MHFSRQSFKVWSYCRWKTGAPCLQHQYLQELRILQMTIWNVAIGWLLFRSCQHTHSTSTCVPFNSNSRDKFEIPLVSYYSDTSYLTIESIDSTFPLPRLKRESSAFFHCCAPIVVFTLLQQISSECKILKFKTSTF